MVKITRIDENVTHSSREMNVLIHPNPSKIPEEAGVSKQFKKAMSGLTRFKPRDDFTPGDITPKIANEYLSLFMEQGTHYVSSMVLGDVIFQVFAMPEERFKRVKKIYADQLRWFNKRLIKSPVVRVFPTSRSYAMLEKYNLFICKVYKTQENQ
ncbi:MAG: MAC/perforin domain-containing protein [Pyrinomonadaceae bacterium]